MSLKKESLILKEILTRLSHTDPSAGGYIWGRDTMTPWYNEKLEKIKKSGQLDADEAPLPTVLPACYFYPQWCAEEFHGYFDLVNNDVEYTESHPPPLFLHGFAYHWHGGGGRRFERSYARGSQFDLTARYVDKMLSVKWGAKSKEDLITMGKSLWNAKKSYTANDILIRDPPPLALWDTDHWYTTGFDPYRDQPVCRSKTISTVTHTVAYVSAAALVIA